MKTPVTFEANEYKYRIITANNCEEVSAHRENSGLLAEGIPFMRHY